MKHFIEDIKNRARADPKRIVFPESKEERTLKAVAQIVCEGTAMPILIGTESEIREKASGFGLNLDGVQFVDHMSKENDDYFAKYAEELVQIRKSKGLTEEKAKKLLSDPIYYGTMMVHLGDADGFVSGAIHSTAETVRPALEIIKTKKKFHKVSGAFFIKFHDEIMLFADAAVTIDPDAKDLAQIAIDSARTALDFGIEPKVAMLSFSTKGSAKHPEVDKVKEATAIAQNEAEENFPEAVIDGEFQLDAAVVPWVAEIKCPGARIKGDANVLIFPDLQSANIGYKLATFFGRAEALGPILQGLNKPANDLSRSCTIQDIVDITALTVVEAQDIK